MTAEFSLPDGFDELEAEEQIEYVQKLWNWISRDRQVPVPAWHRELLAARLSSRSSETDVSWDELRDELRRGG